MPMPIIQLDVDAFGDGQNPVDVERGLYKTLEALVQFNLAYLHANPRTPTLYSLAQMKQVRYIRDPQGVELWRDIPSIIRNGGADCKSLAAFRMSELRLKGEQAQFVLKRRQVGDQVIYHVLLLRADGAYEDPNSVLGMTDPWETQPMGVMMGQVYQALAEPVQYTAGVWPGVAIHTPVIYQLNGCYTYGW